MKINQVIPASGVFAVFDDGRYPVVCWAVVTLGTYEVADGQPRTEVVGMILTKGRDRLDLVGRHSVDAGPKGFVRRVREHMTLWFCALGSPESYQACLVATRDMPALNRDYPPDHELVVERRAIWREVEELARKTMVPYEGQIGISEVHVKEPGDAIHLVNLLNPSDEAEAVQGT